MMRAKHMIRFLISCMILVVCFYQPTVYASEYIYPQNGQLAESYDQWGTTNYEYDKNGNLIQKVKTNRGKIVYSNPLECRC
jgi:YD repeat-containing protein